MRSTRPNRPAMRRMSIEKRIVRRGSSHILIDVLRDSLEGIPVNEDASTSTDDASSAGDQLAPSSSSLLEKHRITIAAVSPRVNRKESAQRSKQQNGGATSPSYYEPHLRCGVYSMQGRRKAMEDAHTIELGSGSYEPRTPKSSSSSTKSSTSSSSSSSSKSIQPDGLGVTDKLSNALNGPASPDNLCAYFGVYDGTCA